MKDGRGKKIVYIKIMYREPLLVPYILGNIVATIEGWLNIVNLNYVFVNFLKFSLNIENGITYRASVAGTL
jgi:hypothetical protein